MTRRLFKNTHINLFYFRPIQLSKLRLALDSETTAHANLVASEKVAASQQDNKILEKNATMTTTTSSLQSSDYKWRGSNSAESTPKKSKQQIEADLARGAFLIGQSEERVQALSVIMLHLCTGLQYAQGVANQ